MTRDNLIIVLATTTLLLVLLGAVWQLYRVKRSQRRHHDPPEGQALSNAALRGQDGRERQQATQQPDGRR
jgi:hypothetical protein